MQSYHVFDRLSGTYINVEGLPTARKALAYIEDTFTVTYWENLEVHRVTVPVLDKHTTSTVDVRLLQLRQNTASLATSEKETF